MTDKENDVMHQGKTISQWVEDFKGMFTYDQLLALAKGGCDLQKILVMGLDENEDVDETSSSVEDAALSELDESIKPNYTVHVKVLGMNTAFCVNAKDEDDAEKKVREQIKKLTGGSNPKVEIEKIESAKQLNESFNDDIVTVEDFVRALKRNLAKDNDKIMFRVYKDKSAYEVFDMHGKGGVFVIDLVPAVANDIYESCPWDNTSGITDEQWQEAYEWFEANGFKVHDSDEGGFMFVKPVNGKQFYPGKEGYELYLSLRDQTMNEGRNWRTGGYGGYGRSYRSYGEVGAPRGKAISWFSVDKLDPKAKGKMYDWRVGPSNFPFKDLLYPERKYKIGTTVLRSKFLKAGDESGVKYIAVPSYLDCVRSDDKAGIELLNALGVPLDLTFGYDPNEDFSQIYTVEASK